jgi:tubulin monoglycylase TTLL3/8
LKPFQIVNHFQKNGAITSKGGLCRNIRNLIGFNLIDIDSFYPRCFELNDANDFEDFIEDYKLTKVRMITSKTLIFKKGGGFIEKSCDQQNRK